MKAYAVYMIPSATDPEKLIEDIGSGAYLKLDGRKSVQSLIRDVAAKPPNRPGHVAARIYRGTLRRGRVIATVNLRPTVNDLYLACKPIMVDRKAHRDPRDRLLRIVETCHAMLANPETLRP